jgi:hypothetical protein
MKKFYNNIRIWSNENLGILTLILIIFALIGMIPFNRIDLTFTRSIFDIIATIIFYNVKFPVYIFLILILVGFIYITKIRQMYIRKKITLDFMSGNWRNEWTMSNNRVGSELFQIKDKGKYYVNGEHFFNLEDFKYDYKTNKITFIKAAVKPGDNRRLSNILILDNNNLLSGQEENYHIKYTRF